ncbi:hypothetical protein TP70_07125 [Staphylococcus microti]|uniref:Uncharacterized protein n=1 Tax=Staphylococcus microti TaxID=569857 RepID=A0A0D6XNT8_9STAP|nr:hypothetical protein [Staphylococcus microti]KIX90459.1 hypothetical protein TP70_07125 [Staphylococcus microti]PNZ83363.1 hypothetical protein CD132_02350 [Staphylococcus microti]SUM57915.1 Uncharacterised protein [Staphylococcus microti]
MIHYVIVGHPIRQKIENVEIEGNVFNISFDGFRELNKNEDPYIFGTEFLYSFCHSESALSSDIRRLVEKRENEVYFIFVARVDKKSTVFEIDTVLKAKNIWEWPKRGERFEHNLDTNIFSMDAIRYHLPEMSNGNLNEHNREKLYTCVADKDKSFLPMVRKKDVFVPFQFSLEISEIILKMLTRGNETAKTFYVVKSPTNRTNYKVDIDDYQAVSEVIEERVITKKETDNFIKLVGEQLIDISARYRNNS